MMLTINGINIFGIPDIVWLIDEMFVWLSGGQEAITCVNSEDNLCKH